MTRNLLPILALPLFLTAHGQGVSEAWVSDQGDGTYLNPVLHADYSDPDACRVGDDYWLTASSFGCSPGLPILHSRDLVNWQIANHALAQVPPLDSLSHTARHGLCVWAPAIRHHDGQYYIYWGDPDNGIYMVRTDDPLGKWSQPVLVKAGKGLIDPCPFWDEDGRAYLVHAYAASRAGFNSVLVICGMNAEGTEVTGQPVLVFDGNDGVNHTCEGPKLYKRNAYYYIMCPAGGVAGGWQLVLRSRNIYGPYEWRRTLDQGQTAINGPHQGAWVETQTGESWFLHFQDKGAYGRVTHLQPMRWQDDWPVMGDDPDGDGCGQPVMRHAKPNVGAVPGIRRTPQDSDEFNSGSPGLQWQWQANYEDSFGFPSGFGIFRLYGHELPEDARNLWTVPNMLLQKFPAEEFTATAKVKVSAKADGQQSGLIVMGLDYGRLSVEKQGETFLLKLITCHDAERGGAERSTLLATLQPTRSYEAGLQPNYEQDVWLRVTVARGAQCTFAYSLDGETFTPCPEQFTAREGKWIGAKVGLYSVAPHGAGRGWMDADWFRVTGDTPPAAAADAFDGKEALNYCDAHVWRTLWELRDSTGGIDYTMVPRNIAPGQSRWTLSKTTPEEWCAGFWPGVLWYDYEYTGDERIRREAERFTASLGYLSQRPVFDHDLGFIIFCSYGNAYRLTGKQEYRQVILDAADTLATLFNPTVGTLLSWPRHVKDYGAHNTIMDNMINLEMLYWASKHGGSPALADIATKHADKTMQHHFRPDHTSYHVALYDTLTGDFIKGVTHQGYANGSMWARGQAWAIYGYTMVYRETGERRFLDFAQQVTDVYLRHLPDDYVPYWDFDDKRIPAAPRDASAACVVASALLELCTYVDAGKARTYKDAALRMLSSLSSDAYRSGDRNSSMLMHSVGNMPANSEVDASIIYADYYYIEALMRLRNLGEEA